MQIGRYQALLLLGAPLLFLAIFFATPMMIMLVASIQAKSGALSAEHYVKVATDWYYWDVLLFTFQMSLWVTLIAFILGYPLAYYLTFVVEGRLLRRIILIIVVTPLFTSNIVRAFGWVVMLGRQGLVNQSLMALNIVDAPVQILYSKTGMVLGLAYVLLPFMVLTISSILQNLDRSLLDAARDLGAGPLTAFLKVTLPLSLPGVVAGSLIVFTLAVSAYVTPSIMSGGRQVVMSMLIYQQYMALFDFNFGAVLSVMLLVMTLILIGAYLLVVERHTRAPA